MEKKEVVCYVDLDGVIVDFCSDFVKLGGSSLQQIIEENELPIPFNIETLLKFKSVYDLITVNFWVQLKKYTWADELLSELEKRFNNNIYFATSAGIPGTDFFNKAVLGKCLWLNEHYHNYLERTIFTYKKGHLGGPNKILIDDNQNNVNEFCANKGYGILFPQYWNNKFKLIDKNIEEVLLSIDCILESLE